MRGPIWTTEEEEALFGLVGDLPWSVVCRSYNQWAIGKKLARRTSKALFRRVNVAKYSVIATGKWIDVPTIALLLGVSGESVRRWIRHKWLDSYKEGRKHYVKRENLRSFAVQHPELFNGKRRDDLLMLLDSAGLADELAKCPKAANTGRETPIVCVETGRIYRSYHVAARSHHVTRQAISQAVRRGHLSGGFHWRRADESRNTRKGSRNRVAPASC